MNKLLTTMLASSVLMMGAMTVAHADDEKAPPAPDSKQQVASKHKHHKHQHHYAAKHQKHHGHNVNN